MKNWKVNILTVKLFSVAAKDRVSSVRETPAVRVQRRGRAPLPDRAGGSNVEQNYTDFTKKKKISYQFRRASWQRSC